VDEIRDLVRDKKNKLKRYLVEEVDELRHLARPRLELLLVVPQH
jgi:hypothetical protein